MVEIIPKAELKPPLWQSIIFYAALLLMLAAIVGIFAGQVIQKNANKVLQGLEDKLGQKEALRLELEKEVFAWQQKIDDFSGLVQNHSSSANFFPLLENLCHPKVQFTELSLSLRDFKAGLAGQAESFIVLEQQLRIFEQIKDIKEVYLSKIGLRKEGGVDFALSLLLNPSLFK